MCKHVYWSHAVHIPDDVRWNTRCEILCVFRPFLNHARHRREGGRKPNPRTWLQPNRSLYPLHPPALQILVIKFQQDLIPALILRPDPLVLQIPARGHPAVDLIGEGLDVLGHGEGGVEGLHVGGRFVLGGEHAEGDGDGFCVGGVDHGGMDFGGGGEGGGGLGGEGDDL